MGGFQDFLIGTVEELISKICRLLDDLKYLEGIQALKAQFDQAAKIEAGANAVESVLNNRKFDPSVQRGVNGLNGPS